MSGMVKFTEVTFDPSFMTHDAVSGMMVLAAVAAARHATAAAEATCRMEAEEAAMTARLQAVKDARMDAVSNLRGALSDAAGKIGERERMALMQRLGTLQESVQAARTYTELAAAMQEGERVRAALLRYAAQAARRPAEGGIAAQRQRFETLKAVAQEPSGDDAGIEREFDTAIRAALASAGGALQTGNEAMIAARVDALEAALQQRSDAMHASLAERAAREQALAEADAILAGLRADATVMRWHEQSVESLAQEMAAISFITAQGDPEQAQEAVRAARQRAEALVREAGAAQIKADQRDYIARSIAQTLEEMGFHVGPMQAEHPGHPATATILHAATASGKGISVSIPVEGQVWYNVHGYPKTVEAAVGGGDAMVCDEAEAVIEQMHDALAGEFHVQMGELMWEGKDPLRNLSAADSHRRREAGTRAGAR